MRVHAALALGRPAVGGLALGLLAVGVAAGCECGSNSEPRGSSERAIAPELAVGFVEGVVRLADGEELPAYPQNPMVVPGRAPLPEGCTPPREQDRTPVTIAEESGGLTNLTIVATSDDEAGWPTPREPVVHEVVIRDCRLEPPTLIATRGDRLRVSNETAYPFFPEVGEGILQALLRGEPREVTLDRGGVRTVQCGFAAPCGRMELVTLYHPVHTVSGANGRFRLEVPAGREVRITAWHPLFLEAHARTQVDAGETRQVELTVRPSALRDVTPPGEPPREASDLDPDPNIPF